VSGKERLTEGGVVVFPVAVALPGGVVSASRGGGSSGGGWKVIGLEVRFAAGAAAEGVAVV
jgi:hypothetical protein